MGITSAKILLRLDGDVNKVGIEYLVEYIPWVNYRGFFLEQAGQNHYRLLAYLSQQLPEGSRAADLGTCHGISAIALAHNPHVRVLTYDPADSVGNNNYDRCYKHLPNIQYFQIDCLNVVEEYVDSKIILLDVNPHDGIQEQRMLDRLCQLNFKGILLLDDIHLNWEMNNFWNNIQLKKYDITHYGHWSGTGIVIFDEEKVSLEIE